MKIKQKLWLTNPEKYACGYHPEFFLTEPGREGKYLQEQGWVALTEIEFEADLNPERFVSSALDKLDAKEKEIKAQYQAKLKEIDNARNDLKALTWEQTA